MFQTMSYYGSELVEHGSDKYKIVKLWWSKGGVQVQTVNRKKGDLL